MTNHIPGDADLFASTQGKTVGGAEKGTQTFFASAQGKTVVENFDVVKQAGGIGRATTLELRDIAAARQLELRFVSKSRYAPMVSGVEVFRQERLEK